MTNVPHIQPPMNAPQPFIMPDAQPTKNGNGMAKASFILGLCSLIPLLGLLTGLLALIFGIIALVKKTNKTWMAVTGLVLAVVLPIPGSLAVILVPAVQNARELARQAGCKANMSALGKGVVMYTTGGMSNAAPTDLDALINASYISKACLHCPSNPNSTGRDYFFLCPDDPNMDPGAIIACDLGNWHSNGGRTILRRDSTVMFCKTDAQFQMILARPENAKFAAALKQAEASMPNTSSGERDIKFR